MVWNGVADIAPLVEHVVQRYISKLLVDFNSMV
jgi:hypothetical protein